MMLPKPTTIRLTGRALAELHAKVHRRDGYKCIIPGCGKYVDPREKAHHEPCGRYKEDVPEKMCLLCYEHHQQRESVNGEVIKQACIDYLNKLYPNRREEFQIPA